MELMGLTLAQVLTALGVVGAAVVVLYLLKLRRRRATVPFVKLWQDVLAEKQTTRLFSQLKRILSLLVALAIVALLALSLGDPRWAGARADARTVVVLIDASASMQATDVAPRRVDVASERARELVRGLGPADRMLIAQMDATTRPLGPMTGEPRLLLEALGGLEAVDVTADLGAGLRFALDVLRDASEPEIVIISDGVLQTPEPELARLAQSGARLSYVPVGRTGRNVAITAFSVRRYPLDKSQSEVLVELWNPSEEDLEVELSLLGDGETIDVQRLAVGAGERLRRFFSDVSGADATLEARLSLADGTRDDLPADDRFYARLPERRRARVLAVTPGNLYLSAALLLDEYLEVVEVSPADYPAPGRFDVVIFDSFVPAVPPDVHAIYLYPEPAAGVRGPLEVTGRIERPAFDHVDRDHPLVRFTALGDVNVASALEVRLGEGDHAVAADARGPLVVTGARGGKRFVALTFDVRGSDLPLRVAWPLLLLNSIDSFVQGDVGYLSSYRTGETWHVPVPAGTREAHVVDPTGARRPAPIVEGRAVYAGTRAGFHRLQVQGAPDEIFAASLGPSEEARIAPVARLTLGDTVAAEPTRGAAGVRRELWLYLVLFALAILLVEWLTYHRRITV